MTENYKLVRDKMRPHLFEMIINKDADMLFQCKWVTVAIKMRFTHYEILVFGNEITDNGNSRETIENYNLIEIHIAYSIEEAMSKASECILEVGF
jgi:hypothetical protein